MGDTLFRMRWNFMPAKLSQTSMRLFIGTLACVAGLAVYVWFGTTTQSTMQMLGGARHVTIQVPGLKASLSLVCFPADKFKMQIVDNPTPARHLYIADMALSNKAVAGCNGGYFSLKDFSPFGLQLAQGVQLGTFCSGGPGAALFGVKDGTPFIAPEKEFQLSSGITDVVQCSPLLVENGNILQTFGNKTNARTFVMTDGEGQWAIGVANNLGLDDLAALLAKPGLVDGFHVRRAMNLDGGPSTGLWWQDSNGQPHSQKERWSVRNMVLVIPK
ncbi:MAG: hypothetical protein JWO94_368 [Verrucomicrobiaceae bacterium]|nr:hypothetical protein [Verrucomicrobiaceae bacterium]